MIEIKKCDNSGYNRVIEYGAWTVANLGYCDDTSIDKIDSFQKHYETDEVFILLKGNAYLILLDGDIFDVNKLKFVKLLPNNVYNVKKGVYHQHVLSEDANLLIVENRNTDDDKNSKRLYLTEDEIDSFKVIAKENIHV